MADSSIRLSHSIVREMSSSILRSLYLWMEHDFLDLEAVLLFSCQLKMGIDTPCVYASPRNWLRNQSMVCADFPAAVRGVYRRIPSWRIESFRTAQKAKSELPRHSKQDGIW